MINSNENDNANSTTGANGPVSVTKLKEYGKKAYAPLVDVVSRYQDDIIPYMSALAKGLQGGVETLNREGSSEAERYVSQFFKEAADGLQTACEKVSSKDVNAITSFLSEQAEKRPSVMFSTSYIAGLFLGRLGRHIIRNKTQTGTDTATETETNTMVPPSFDQPDQPIQ